MSDPTTPNMNLTQPIVGVDSGISAANSYNANFTTIDQHNHSVGNGVQITPSGININDSLPFNNQAATGMSYLGITTQGSGIPAPINYSVYFSGLEFYVKDGAGNAVQITSGGTVNATSSGISNGTASASFIGSTLVVNADTNKPANIQGASYLFGNNVTSSHFLTLSPPNAMAADYGLVLPPIPATKSIMAIDTSGNITGAYTADNNTIDINGSSQLEVKDAGITTQKIADASITRAKMAAAGQYVSSSCGSFTTSSTSPVNVTNLSLVPTLTGRPVLIVLQPDGTGNQTDVQPQSTGAFVQLYRDTTLLANWTVTTVTNGLFGASFTYVDIISAGSYTYRVKFSSAAASASTIRNYVLFLMELY